LEDEALLALAGSCEHCIDVHIPPRGVEQTSNSSGKLKFGDQGGAESGAVGAGRPAIDDELAKLLKAWPKLPPAIRTGILGMVNAAGRCVWDD
jgi:hypothetical protein